MRVPLCRSRGAYTPLNHQDEGAHRGQEEWQSSLPQVGLQVSDTDTTTFQGPWRRQVEDRAHPRVKEKRAQAQVAAMAAYRLPSTFA